jgi:hypothetical protein
MCFVFKWVVGAGKGGGKGREGEKCEKESSTTTTASSNPFTPLTPFICNSFQPFTRNKDRVKARPRKW